MLYSLHKLYMAAIICVAWRVMRYGVWAAVCLSLLVRTLWHNQSNGVIGAASILTQTVILFHRPGLGTAWHTASNMCFAHIELRH